MLDKSSTERITGVLFILLFLILAIGIVTGTTQLDFERPDVRKSLQDVIDNQELVITSSAFMLAGALLMIVSAAALYRLFGGHDGFLALIGLAGMLSGGVMLVTSVTSSFGAFFLARDFVDGVADADSLAMTARAIALAASALFLAGLTALGAGMTALGALMVRSRAVPGWLGWWAVLSGVLMLAAFIIVNTANALSVIPGIGAILFVVFFLVLGIRVLARGIPEPDST